MNPVRYSGLALLFSTAFAADVVVTPVMKVVDIPITHVAERTVTIKLGHLIIYVQPPLIVPITVEPGTTVRIVSLPPHDKYGPVRWFKGAVELPATGGTLEISSATMVDSGDYSASARDADGRYALPSAEASLLVASRLQGQRLCSVAARVHLDPQRPSFVSGFVIEPGAWSVLVLVRAVGPALAQFGVQVPLAAPELRVFDQRGQRIQPLTDFKYPSAEEAARRVGAFALPPAGKDVAYVFDLRGGSYTVETAAPNSSSGTVLVEVYQVPLQ